VLIPFILETGLMILIVLLDSGLPDPWARCRDTMAIRRIPQSSHLIVYPCSTDNGRGGHRRTAV